MEHILLKAINVCFDINLDIDVLECGVCLFIYLFIHFYVTHIDQHIVESM